MEEFEHIKIPKEYIPVKTKLNYSNAQIANGLFNGIVFANLSFFYHQKLGADPIPLGIEWLLFAIWNTTNDPLFAYIIDNTRSDIGRRIPYI